MTKKQHEVSILGDRYTIMSDESAESVSMLTQKVDALMKDIASKTGLKDVRRIAVLAAIKLMHQVQELETSVQQKDREESQLINYINQQLSSLSS